MAIFDQNGWVEGATPNNQDALAVNGLKPESKKIGFTLDFWEKMGDMSPVLGAQRYLNEQCHWNLPSIVFVLIDSNFRQSQLFTDEENQNVMNARLNEVQGTKGMTFFKATDLIRKINQKPPLVKEQESIDAIRAELTFRIDID